MTDPNKKVAVKITKRLSSSPITGARAQIDGINDAAAALMHTRSLITTVHKGKNYSAWFAGQGRLPPKTHQSTNQCKPKRLID
jgi:hypothetical protein